MHEPGFVIGNIAKGDDLWDRHEIIKEIWDGLEKSSILLKAPRRFGKTSIMYNLYENPNPELKVIFIDTEGQLNPQEFIAKLMSEMFRNGIFGGSCLDWFKKRLPSLDEIGFEIGMEGTADFRIKLKESIGKEWQENGSEFMLKAKESREKILIILDELPLLVQNIRRKYGADTACDFMLWFRSIRQELPNVKWVVGGSIGIEHILNEIKAGTKVINDFHITSVGPFSLENGRDYIKALLKNEGQIARVKTSVIDEIMEIIGAPVPFFIQVLVKESLYEMRRSEKKQLSSEIIRKAYKDGVLGPASRTYFEHYFTRLKDYYNHDMESMAKRLILEIARKGRATKTELFKLFRQLSGGKLTDENFSHLMTDIENDFYVSYDTEDKSYAFTTNLLKDWWLRYYDMVEE